MWTCAFKLLNKEFCVFIFKAFQLNYPFCKTAWRTESCALITPTYSFLNCGKQCSSSVSYFIFRMRATVMAGIYTNRDRWYKSRQSTGGRLKVHHMFTLSRRQAHTRKKHDTSQKRKRSSRREKMHKTQMYIHTNKLQFSIECQIKKLIINKSLCEK